MSDDRQPADGSREGRRFTAYLATAALGRTGVEAMTPALLLAALTLGRPPLDGVLLVAAATASAALGGPFAGAVLDQVRRPALAYAGVLCLTCGGLALLGRLMTFAPLPPLMAVAAVIGIGHPMLSGALTAQLARILPAWRLPRALSLDVAVFSVAGMAGPALAGLGVTFTAEGQLLLVGAPFALALLPLGGMRLPRRAAGRGAGWPAIGSGLRAMVADRVLREVTVLTSFTAFAQAGLVVAAPLLSVALTGGLRWTGVLLVTLAAGNLVVSVVTARWPLRGRPEVVVRASAVAYAALLCLLGLVKGPPLTLVVMFLAGTVTAPLFTGLFRTRFERSPLHVQSGVFGTGAGLRSFSFACGAATLGVVAQYGVVWCLLAAGLAQLAGLALGLLTHAPWRPAPPPREPGVAQDEAPVPGPAGAL
ncbi:MFS transporter [Sphaerisporangium rubeum]|uniref:MFS family permease n=1 Tax=Sphaerisporangium rubeum TaxID=321317 RepID=A0A7X0IJA0_9ACTN|nr:MFS transporter [Sphaerisporangium rubeum]MBB6475719.1 MFS family permease [Sphaerisporangium rubeum]